GTPGARSVLTFLAGLQTLVANIPTAASVITAAVVQPSRRSHGARHAAHAAGSRFVAWAPLGVLEYIELHVLEPRVVCREEGLHQTGTGEKDAPFDDIVADEADAGPHDDVEQARALPTPVQALGHDRGVRVDGAQVVCEVAVGMVQQVARECTNRTVEFDPILRVVPSPSAATAVAEPYLLAG